MQKLLDKLPVPRYARMPLLVVLIYNCVVFFCTRLVNSQLYHYNFTTPIDKAIPFVPWMVIIYFGCYAFWVVNYIMATTENKRTAYRFILADLMTKTICLFFFLFMPTTMERAEITGGGASILLMKLLYAVDSPDNLFPSIHCIVSWLCFLGIRKNPKIPKWYIHFSWIFAILVFISTLTVKQHLIADVIAGVVFAQVCYWLAGVIVNRHKDAKLFE